MAKPMIAGVSVSAATMVTRTPIAQGIPALRNIPTSAKPKPASATDTVNADPITTGATAR